MPGKRFISVRVKPGVMENFLRRTPDRMDPATASAPFVATLVDVTGLIIYFTVALLILRGTLL